MKWINVKEALPDKEMDIVVLIGGNIFLGKAQASMNSSVYLHNPELVIFEYPVKYTSEIGSLMSFSRGWILPSHFKKPTHWMHLPEKPDEVD